MKKKTNTKRFCEKCGNIMNTTMHTSGFNRYTGKEIQSVSYVCPEIDSPEMLQHPEYYSFSFTFKGHYHFTELL